MGLGYIVLWSSWTRCETGRTGGSMAAEPLLSGVWEPRRRWCSFTAETASMAVFISTPMSEALAANGACRINPAGLYQFRHRSCNCEGTEDKPFYPGARQSDKPGSGSLQPNTGPAGGPATVEDPVITSRWFKPLFHPDVSGLENTHLQQ